jgi:hypothetical protein
MMSNTGTGLIGETLQNEADCVTVGRGTWFEI